MRKPTLSRFALGTVVLVSALIAPAAEANHGQITTFAGGSTGDGNLGTAVSVASPMGMATDAQGNLLFAERDAHRVRKLSPSGIITTVAGSGESGLFGDGGPATASRLNSPTSVAIDLTGNLFISDTGNNRIRKVGPDGTISTFVGQNCYATYICPLGDNGSAVSGGLNGPRGITMMGSDLLISDTYNSRIRRVRNGIITTIIGTGARGLAGDGGPATMAKISWPFDVTADPFGNVFIADQQNFRVRKVDANAVITTVLGGGLVWDAPVAPGTLAGTAVEGLTADVQGNVYIAEPNRIRKLEPSGLVKTVAGGRVNVGYQGCQSYPPGPDCPQVTIRPIGDGGAAVTAGLSSPGDVIALPNGSLAVADTGHHRVRLIDTNGLISTIAGNGWARYWGDGGPASQASLNGARDVAADASGNLFICDTENHRIRRVAPDGVITTYAESLEGEIYIDGARVATGSFTPSAIAIDGRGNKFISDAKRNQILVVTPANAMVVLAGNGQPGFTDGWGTSASFRSPRGIALDGNGSVVVADTGNHAIRIVTLAGFVSTVVGDGTPGGSPDGAWLFGARLSAPEDVAVDAAGGILIADTGNHGVRRVFQNVITRLAGPQFFASPYPYYPPSGGFSGDGGPAKSAWLHSPRGVFVDYTGTIYVSDTGNQRVRRIDYLGNILTIAGNGTVGLAGDNGLAVQASLKDPMGLAVDDRGDLFIADLGNGRVRRVSPTS